MKKYASKQGSQLTKTANGYKFQISQDEWKRIGKEAGWLKTAFYADYSDWRGKDRKLDEMIAFHDKLTKEYSDAMDGLTKEDVGTPKMDYVNTLEDKIERYESQIQDYYDNLQGVWESPGDGLGDDQYDDAASYGTPLHHQDQMARGKGTHFD